jgi:hypothetical protein
MNTRSLLAISMVLSGIPATTYACGGVPRETEDETVSSSSAAIENCPRGMPQCNDIDEPVDPPRPPPKPAPVPAVVFPPIVFPTKTCNTASTSRMQRVVIARRATGTTGCTDVNVPLCGTWRGASLFAAAGDSPPVDMCRYTWEGPFPVPSSAATELKSNVRDSSLWGAMSFDDLNTVGDGSSTQVQVAPIFSPPPAPANVAAATSSLLSDTTTVMRIHGCEACVAHVDTWLYVIIPAAQIGRPLYLTQPSSDAIYKVTLPTQTGWAAAPPGLLDGPVLLGTTPPLP